MSNSFDYAGESVWAVALGLATCHRFAADNKHQAADGRIQVGDEREQTLTAMVRLGGGIP